jgi:hypothetical protein
MGTWDLPEQNRFPEFILADSWEKKSPQEIHVENFFKRAGTPGKNGCCAAPQGFAR